MANVSDSNPRIYVACLAAYNNGYLHGAWIDADQDTDQIRDEIAAMLARSPVEGAEEYAIHDYEGFEGVSISEYAGIDTVARMAAFIAEHGALGAGRLEQFSGDMDQAESTLEDCYHGQFASLADYMEELTTESVTIPEALRYYVDWNAMARDAEMGGDLFTIETAHGEVHVFSNR
ncbi:antirestriction protein ArdA [Hyphomicrobium zavarzinii]|jgi:antirestriction protein|uniref:antirestriction protein ArdA n=1 Tax=Hyphomicrobium zavarzinii TaxID=48292 RepID=UPI00036392B8|nr:antirestriction protein ArdA [Hyphomicrobium zavarzinii]